ncbi:hypothetical protein QNI19_24375 [Cytophagaceae bacterium DM2B3-1]|uniref:Uncharacterized protein n=1 Tax=Xanthocytophaga flava TaxID=3048013 RepID=A0ABT7CQR7_9BACT|nr:hypothetical protein [Xanthocytophaga flavus]MDJ1496095.1 hypothetical protein [Xanthocytophaga flavus]
MKQELFAFFEKYHLQTRRKVMILLSLAVIASLLATGIILAKGLDNALSTPHLFIAIVLDMVFIGFLLFKTRQISTNINRIKDLLHQSTHAVKTIQLYRKGKKDSYEGITYSMKISIIDMFGAMIEYYLDEFHQNEHLFNEGISVFSQAYPEVKIMHFAD